MGAFTTEIATDLGDFERESEIAFVLDDVASQRNGVVKAQSLVGFFGGFGGFDKLVDLLFGVAASFGEKDFGAIDNWGLDTEITMVFVSIDDVLF